MQPDVPAVVSDVQSFVSFHCYDDCNNCLGDEVILQQNLLVQQIIGALFVVVSLGKKTTKKQKTKKHFLELYTWMQSTLTTASDEVLQFEHFLICGPALHFS